ncbi:hypothetical protein CDO73_05630 [Saccharibacillus sp. O23]|uniref:protein adenylyltransferase SelO n=1 Tax=Saccharibacillus sp. O23 TaxID=2009338 RepID=UPI000B4E61AA|nr:protein adenylyltransferase SelO [Saccharibacillus sp. O23]OWR31954.1 hypothetical protein CDO73_05630 [Saccharibacillus sp. O23]
MTDNSVNRSSDASAGWNLDHSYAALSQTFYSSIEPVPVANPQAVLLNDALAEELGLNPEWLHGEEAAAVFGGNLLPKGAQPLAQAYAGHQFGNFTRLGDGRAVLLGEQLTPSGRRSDIQLKGSGRTPFSRGGDGRAALGPMLREYIVSEAMHALNIPTTRSLAVVATGEDIRRETPLPGAVLTRVAASHLRVGTFQYALRWGGVEALRELADYAIARHYPEIRQVSAEAARQTLAEMPPAHADEPNPGGIDGDDRAKGAGEAGAEQLRAADGAEGAASQAAEQAAGGEAYALLLRSVMESQASLVSRWMLVGFIHGVMNTDNVTISGETIDYGPCAFMDAYDPATVFSSIDTGGRYAYGNQPYITLWNLSRLAEAMIPLLDEDADRGMAIAEEILGGFERLYLDNWFDGMRAKLGLSNREEADEQLIADLLDLMKAFRADYTNTFVGLTFGVPGADEVARASERQAEAAEGEAGNAELDFAGIAGGSEADGGGSSAGRADEASDGSSAEWAGEAGGRLAAEEAGESAYRPTSFPGADALLASGEYRVWRERWRERLERQTDSSEEVRERMRAHNPAVIPRNHRVEEALAAATQSGDYGPLRRLLAALAQPYAHSAEQAEYAQLPPEADGSYRTFCGT